MKKKICFIVSTPFTAKAFLLKHFEVLSVKYDIFLVANFDGFDLSEFENIPVTIKHIPIVRSIHVIKDLKALFLLKSYLGKMQFNAIHSVTPKAGLIAMLAGKLGGVKNRIHIFTGQVWHTKKGVFKIILMFLDRIISKCATIVLVDGHSQRNFLIEHNIIKKEHSFVIGKGSISGVDLEKFVPTIDVKHEMRKQLNYSDKDVVFMFLGRMNLDKGILDLAVAFQKLHSEFTNAKLLLVGPDEENLTPKINEIIQDNSAVIFTGHTNNPISYLQAADVFCMPSYREGFGTSVIEASLMKLPIICSDTYGLFDTIIDKNTGLRHKVANSDSIYEAMKTLYLDENLRIVYGENGSNYVINNFSAHSISMQWLSFYTNLLN